MMTHEGAPGAATHWTMEMVPVADSVRLAVGKTGVQDEHAPLIALHGITAHHRSFNAIARHITHPGGVYGVDLRGRGNSDKPASGYGHDQHARDIVALLDSYGIERAVVMGHSMGAFVAVQVALLFPKRVCGLVLMDGGFPADAAAQTDPTSTEAKEMQEGLMRAFNRLSMSFALPDAYLDYWFPGQGVTLDLLPPDLADYYRYDLRQGDDGGWRPKCAPRAATEDGVWTMTHAPKEAEMAAVTCPVALVRAEQGFIPGSGPLVTPAALEAFKRALDVQADLYLPASNHYTMVMDPFATQIAAAVDQFVSALGARG